MFVWGCLRPAWPGGPAGGSQAPPCACAAGLPVAHVCVACRHWLLHFGSVTLSQALVRLPCFFPEQRFRNRQWGYSNSGAEKSFPVVFSWKSENMAYNISVWLQVVSQPPWALVSSCLSGGISACEPQVWIISTYGAFSKYKYTGTSKAVGFGWGLVHVAWKASWWFDAQLWLRATKLDHL